MKKPTRTDIKREHLYKYYKDNLGGEVNEKDYSTILKTFHSKIITDILYTGKIFYLPFGLGQISIKSRIPKVKIDENFEVVKHNMPVNWRATNELWEIDEVAKATKKLIFYNNSHTSDEVYRVAWDRNGCSIAGLKSYQLKPAKHFKRGLTQVLKENGNLRRK